jgi:uncharacterized protein YecT (DUF1311 family)
MIVSLILPLLAQAAGPLPECDEKAAEMGIQQPMNQCAYRDFLIADQELNVQWKITAEAIKARDTDFAVYAESDNRPGWFESLREAQRAWLRYRDAHCRVDGYTARGGSMEPMLVSFCKTHLTRQRTEQLRQLAEMPF